MDLDVMAKAFANMGSNEQAMFLATAFQEMGNYSGGKGAYGREMQMLHIKDEFDAQPDAREFITTLYEMTCIVDKPQVAWDDYPGSSQYAIAKADELIYEYASSGFLPQGVMTELPVSKQGTSCVGFIGHREPGEIPFKELKLVSCLLYDMTVPHGEPMYGVGDRVMDLGKVIGTIIQADPSSRIVAVEASFDMKGKEYTLADLVAAGLDLTEGGYHYVGDATRKAVPVGPKIQCDECKGTGWYVGLTSREPCSRGCAHE